MAMKTSVSMENTNAWMKPTKISKNRNGRGTRYGTKNPTIIKSTSPAKMFPNNRNENDTILAISEINSRRPIKVGTPFRLKNFPA